MKTTMLLAGVVAWLFSGEAARIQDSRPPAPPVAAHADVESVDAILKALYDVISGPAGQERDWNRMRSLFTPKAQLTAVVPRPEGGARAIVMSVDDYIQRAGPRLKESG